MDLYGISLEDYDAMLAQQNGACAICKKKYRRTLGVDHCHATGVVRGLLCHKCNIGLGCYDDEPSSVQAAAAYLKASRGDRSNVSGEGEGALDVADEGPRPAP